MVKKGTKLGPRTLPTLKRLREDARDAGLKNYSKLSKTALADKMGAQLVPVGGSAGGGRTRAPRKPTALKKVNAYDKPRTEMAKAAQRAHKMSGTRGGRNRDLAGISKARAKKFSTYRKNPTKYDFEDHTGPYNF